MKANKLFTEFYNSEKSGGIVLVICTIVSLIIANTAFQSPYLSFWKFDIAGYSLQHWINDGLMAIFFLLIGLELEREFYKGELSNIKNAMLPLFAAIGGMLFPALFYSSFNFGSTTQSGVGIPMATDIAFALGILSLLGKRVPTSLKIFLTAVAVIDDLGAILIIAFFYTKGLVLTNLFIALGIYAFLIVLNRLKVNSLVPYILGGIVMWYFMHNSGVHATITGVLLAFAIPFGDGHKKSASYKLQHFLHKPVAFIILPLFALANTAIVIGSDFLVNFGEPFALGIMFGLILGKPIGITLMSYLSVKLKLSQMPDEIKWSNIMGTGFLAGIGFTMSIFITILAFDSPQIVNDAKLFILIASLIAGIAGYTILAKTLNKTASNED